MFSGMIPPATRARSSPLRRGCGAPFTGGYEKRAIQTRKIRIKEDNFICMGSPVWSLIERERLFSGEALEVGHLRGHFLAGGVGGGANTLDAQLKFVGVGGARESFVEGDELLGVE